MLRASFSALAVTALRAPSPATLTSLLPARPTPPTPATNRELDGASLIGMTRVGACEVSPDGSKAILATREYDFEAKKFDESLWLVDLARASTLDDAALRAHAHIQPLIKGSASSARWSPCGDWIAFLSDRDGDKDDEKMGKVAIWTLPITRPGEATLFKRFPVDVENLDWTPAGLVVSAKVYVDEDASKCALRATATRDAAPENSGGLNAHLFKRLPVREWDRWLDAKFAHPFLQAAELRDGAYVAADAAVDGLRGVPTACPSGAFGGADDWSVASSGAVAFSCRPPLAPDEAWTTNRHVYLKAKFDEAEAACLTADNPGFDFAPACAAASCSRAGRGDTAAAAWLVR